MAGDKDLRWPMKPRTGWVGPTRGVTEHKDELQRQNLPSDYHLELGEGEGKGEEPKEEQPMSRRKTREVHGKYVFLEGGRSPSMSNATERQEMRLESRALASARCQSLVIWARATSRNDGDEELTGAQDWGGGSGAAHAMPVSREGFSKMGGVFTHRTQDVG